MNCKSYVIARSNGTKNRERNCHGTMMQGATEVEYSYWAWGYQLVCDGPSKRVELYAYLAEVYYDLRTACK